MIRIDAIGLAVAPVDLHMGLVSALARAVAVFGSAQPRWAYLFAHRRGNRIKVLVHDGLGLWLAVRRLHRGRFAWSLTGERVTLSREQFDSLLLGLPWQRRW
jgi:transposase